LGGRGGARARSPRGRDRRPDFDLLVVSLYEFESINLYGTEVTAARAVAEARRRNDELLLQHPAALDQGPAAPG